MSVPNPIVFTPFDELTAEELNDMRANEDALAAGTAIDDISLAVTDLANPYKFKVYKTTGQTGVSSNTKITYQTELFDTNNNFASSTYTAPVSGFYFVKASIYIASSTTFASLDYYINGTLYQPGDAQSSSSSGDVVVSNTTILQLTAGQTLECYVRFNGGGTRSIFGVTDVVVGTTGPSLFEGYLVSRT